MKSVTTPIAEISFDDHENILHITMVENAAMTLENAKVHYDIINELVGEKRYFALVDASNFYTIEKEAWLYVSQRSVSGNRIATAHFNTSIGNKIITNFYKTNHNSAVPLQVFNTKPEAIRWLKTFT